MSMITDTSKFVNTFYKKISYPNELYSSLPCKSPPPFIDDIVLHKFLAFADTKDYEYFF